MERLFKISSGLLVLCVFLLGCGKTKPPDAPDETFYINLTPETMTADIGDTLELTGNINSVEALFAISFDLVYDTSVVEFLSISLPQAGILGPNAISFSNRIDDGISISLGRTQTSGNDNVSASGSLFEVNFTASGAGSTEILYQNIYIIDQDGVVNADLGNIEARGLQMNVN